MSDSFGSFKFSIFLLKLSIPRDPPTAKPSSVDGTFEAVTYCPDTNEDTCGLKAYETAPLPLIPAIAAYWGLTANDTGAAGTGAGYVGAVPTFGASM